MSCQFLGTKHLTNTFCENGRTRRKQSTPVRGTHCLKRGVIASPDRTGSSPPVRGTQSLSVLARVYWHRPVHPRPCGEHSGLIAVNSERGKPVHPRPCGEHSTLDEPALLAHRVWFIPARAGNTPPQRHVGQDVIVRFIPARAGNTWQIHGASVATSLAGSSPPVRGTPRALISRACRPASSVHPRPCGEHPAQ